MSLRVGIVRHPVLLSLLAGGALSCAGLIDLERVDFTAAPNDAGAEVAELAPEGGVDAGVLDGSSYCQSKANAAVCVQFDDGSNPSTIGIVQQDNGGSVTIERVDDAPSSPSILRLATPSGTGEAVFGIGGAWDGSDILIEFKVKLSPGDSSLLIVASVALEGCGYWLGTNSLAQVAYADGGNLTFTGQPVTFANPLPRDQWARVGIALVHDPGGSTLTLELTVDGERRLRTPFNRCAPSALGTGVGLGPIGPGPFDARYDDLAVTLSAKAP